MRWALKTQSEQIILISQLSHIVHIDGSKVFSIIAKNGNVINDVQRVTFLKTELSDIQTPHQENGTGILARQVSEMLTVSNIKPDTPVYIISTDGTTLKKVVASSSSIDIPVYDLPQGTYILRVGNVNVKFIKR